MANVQNYEKSSTDLEYGKSSAKDASLGNNDMQRSLESPKEDAATTKLKLKLDLHIVPTLTIIYIMSFLDRVNIGNALLFHLPQDLHLQGEQVNTALAIFFASYVVFEIPATMLMKTIKPHRFLSAAMFLFGLLMTMQGLVQNYGGLIATRFLMGIAEAGVYPCCYYLISMWYRRHEAQKRFTLFFIGASFAAAFGGLLASAIGLMDGVGGYSAWRWIFILEGLLTVVISCVSYFTIADFPEDAKWLSEIERSIVLSRLAGA